MAEDAKTVMSAYFAAWRARDAAAMRALLADDVTFAGPLGRANGADEYVEAFQRLFAITTDVVVELMVARENDVLSWFELHTSVAPPTPVANLARVDAGKVERVRVTFDPRAIIAGRSG